MTKRDRLIYHQIHPIKLSTDWLMGVLALAFFWRHQLAYALLIAFVPSILASIILMREANLERLKASPFGRFIEKNMTVGTQTIRFIGFAIMALAAWYHAPWLIAGGFLVILAGWFLWNL